MIIKVCGLRQPDNISQISRLGVQWMGFIFYPPSPRFVRTEMALPQWLHGQTDSAMGQIKRIGVFVQAPIDEVVATVQEFQLDGVQLHGNEPQEYCQKLREECNKEGLSPLLIKAFRVDGTFDFGTTLPYCACCDYLLFDTKAALQGGTGQQFDWELLQQYRGTKPFLLSGGIGPADVDSLAIFHHPMLAGIDLNSRFETSPGVKDPVLLGDFIQNFTSSFSNIQ